MANPKFIYKYPNNSECLYYLCSNTNSLIIKYFEDINIFDDNIRNNLINYNKKNRTSLQKLLYNPYFIHKVKQYEKYIDFNDFCFFAYTPKQIEFLNNNIDKINWEYLSGNPNAISILEKNIDKINWLILSSNPNAISILKENINKINWDNLSGNPNAISILEENIDKINWYSLSGNPNAIHLLEKNINKIDWKKLCSNPNGIDLLTNYIEKTNNNKIIDFEQLARNPNGIDLLTKYQNPLDINNLALNPNAIDILEKYIYNIIDINYGYFYHNYIYYKKLICYRLSLNRNNKVINIIDKLINNYNIDITLFSNLAYREEAFDLFFKLDYKRMKLENSVFLEELVSKVFNPNRLLKLCEQYNLTFDEINDIY